MLIFESLSNPVLPRALSLRTASLTIREHIFLNKIIFNVLEYFGLFLLWKFWSCSDQMNLQNEIRLDSSFHHFLASGYFRSFLAFWCKHTNLIIESINENYSAILEFEGNIILWKLYKLLYKFIINIEKNII